MYTAGGHNLLTVLRVLFADSLSVAILALQCVEHDHRNRNVKPLLKKPLATLIALQQPDGGFGSLHTTALAIRVSTDLFFIKICIYSQCNLRSTIAI